MTYPVYATVPSANYTPDNYADTVTIAVTYAHAQLTAMQTHFIIILI